MYLAKIGGEYMTNDQKSSAARKTWLRCFNRHQDRGTPGMPLSSLLVFDKPKCGKSA